MRLPSGPDSPTRPLLRWCSRMAPRFSCAMHRQPARIGGIGSDDHPRADPERCPLPTTTVADVLALAREAGVLIVDLRFVDLPGLCSTSPSRVKELTEDLFTDGIGFDGSTIRGFQQIHESDMLLMPGSDDGVHRPALEVPTLDPHLRRRRPGTARAVHARPALRRAEGRGATCRDAASRRPRTGARGRVLHLQLAPLRPDRQQRLSTTSTPRRASGTPARTATAEPRLPSALQGGLLPGPAARQAAGPALARWSSR